MGGIIHTEFSNLTSTPLSPPLFALRPRLTSPHLSGNISWDEIVAIVCPEYAEIVSIEKGIVKKLRDEIDKLAAKAGYSKKDEEAWDEHLRLQFDSIDEEHSGFLGKAEFSAKLRDLGINLPEKSMDILFSSIVKGDGSDASISYEDYVALLCPEKVTLYRRKTTVVNMQTNDVEALQIAFDEATEVEAKENEARRVEEQGEHWLEPCNGLFSSLVATVYPSQ